MPFERLPAGSRILGEEPGADETDARDALEHGIRPRTCSRLERLTPTERRDDQQRPEADEIHLLDPSSRTQAESTDGLSPGVIAGTGGAGDEEGGGEQDPAEG